ncbi:MAG: hypothetical protein QXP36_09855 [Conexivisphaerales archaeon]
MEYNKCEEVSRVEVEQQCLRQTEDTFVYIGSVEEQADKIQSWGSGFKVTALEYGIFPVMVLSDKHVS